MKKSTHYIFLIFFCLVAILASTSVSAAAVDGKPNMNKPGMYVWRDGNNWHVRMVSGKGYYYYNGSLKATAPFNYVQNNQIEQSDDIEQTWPALVTMKMSAGDYGRDGFDFSIPNNKGLCLRGAGTSGGKIYVGSGSTVMNTPADLLWSGACGDKATTASLKYHPGHYVALPPQDDRSMIIKMATPGVKGVVIRYYWRHLEPEYGKYNFSKIAGDLQVAADHGMRLIVLIEDKTFKSVKPTPSYLWSNGNTLPQQNGNGYIAARWKPYVVKRMNALIRAMGNRFDKHPYFEGITFQETATGVSYWNRHNNGYTPEKYRDAIISVLKTSRDAFPTSQVFWCMNFLDEKNPYIGDIANRMAPFDIAMGGPDVLIENKALKEHTYPYYTQFQNQMTLFGSMQYDSYRHRRSGGWPSKYYRMWEMYNFARDKLHVNYIFWTRAPKRNPSDSYQYIDAKPTISDNQWIN